MLSHFGTHVISCLLLSKIYVVYRQIHDEIIEFFLATQKKIKLNVSVLIYKVNDNQLPQHLNENLDNCREKKHTMRTENREILNLPRVNCEPTINIMKIYHRRVT